MQAPAGPLDEPGPELGHRAQRLRCARKISLKLWFSNRLRPVQCHWCYPSLQIHFSGRATEPHQLPPPPSPTQPHLPHTEQHGSRWRDILKRWGSGADVYGLKLNHMFDDCLGCSNHLNHPAGNPDHCCNITSVKTERYLRFVDLQTLIRTYKTSRTPEINLIRCFVLLLSSPVNPLIISKQKPCENAFSAEPKVTSCPTISPKHPNTPHVLSWQRKQPINKESANCWKN